MDSARSKDPVLREAIREEIGKYAKKFPDRTFMLVGDLKEKLTGFEKSYLSDHSAIFEELKSLGFKIDPAGVYIKMELADYFGQCDQVCRKEQTLTEAELITLLTRNNVRRVLHDNMIFHGVESASIRMVLTYLAKEVRPRVRRADVTSRIVEEFEFMGFRIISSNLEDYHICLMSVPEWLFENPKENKSSTFFYPC